jgi:hypothetical protein
MMFLAHFRDFSLPVNAAIAVANLQQMSCFENESSQKLIRILVNAIHHTLVRDLKSLSIIIFILIVCHLFLLLQLKLDFPPNSNVFFDDWKLMVGLSNLVKSPAAKKVLLELGLVEIIEQALRKEDADPRLTKNALSTLWLLHSSDRGNRA